MQMIQWHAMSFVTRRSRGVNICGLDAVCMEPHGPGFPYHNNLTVNTLQIEPSCGTQRESMNVKKVTRLNY